MSIHKLSYESLSSSSFKVRRARIYMVAGLSFLIFGTGLVGTWYIKRTPPLSAAAVASIQRSKNLAAYNSRVTSILKDSTVGSAARRQKLLAEVQEGRKTGILPISSKSAVGYSTEGEAELARILLKVDEVSAEENEFMLYFRTNYPLRMRSLQSPTSYPKIIVDIQGSDMPNPTPVQNSSELMRLMTGGSRASSQPSAR